MSAFCPVSAVAVAVNPDFPMTHPVRFVPLASAAPAHARDSAAPALKSADEILETIAGYCQRITGSGH
jgi:hypothetical protein